MSKDIKSKTLPENIDSILPLLGIITDAFSTRSRNAFNDLLRLSNYSIKEWYKTVTSPRFSVIKVRNIGARTAEELYRLITAVKGYLEAFTDERSVAEAVERYNNEGIEPQTKNNRQQVIENIIREAGRPVSFSKLYKEFCKRCPDSKLKESSFRSAISSCSEVMPIGRTGNYTLKEWTEGTARGGTIREITHDYLASLNPPIAPYDKVVRVIKKHRPRTLESSFLSNIKADKSGQFVFYYLNGVRYLGLKDSYPEDYFPWTKDMKQAQIMSINYPKLKKFVSSKKRFPFSSESGTAGELGVFWEQQCQLYEKKKLDSHSRKYHKTLLAEYGEALITREEYEWRQMMRKFPQAFKSGQVKTLTSKDWSWFADAYTNLQQNELTITQRKDVYKIIQVMKECGERFVEKKRKENN